MKKIVVLLFFSLSFLFAKPVVTTSILPTKYFVEQIAGGTVEVNVMVGKGADPHTYEPKPAQMKALENSVLYFAIGIEFEDVWLDRFKKSYPNLKIILTQKDVSKIDMVEHHHHAHSHDSHHDHDHSHDAHHDHSHDHTHDHHHDHSGNDPHIWLDPMLVKIQAKNIAEALSKQFPENKKLYADNLRKFYKELNNLDKFIKDQLKDLKNRKFMVYHPSWGYFAKRYDLEQIPIEIEGKEPKPADLAELIKKAKDEKINVIFVAPQFSKKAANQISKETNSKVIEIDQLPENWEEELRKTAEIFAKSLK